MKYLLMIFCLPLALIAQMEEPRVSPEKIEQELETAEAQFDHALKLFNPWYTGPIITPNAQTVAPGHAMIQPYIYFTDNYASFNSHRHSYDVPNKFTVLVQPVHIEIGITPSMDTTIVLGGSGNWQDSHSGYGLLDTTVALGFQIVKQTLYVPKAKFSITQLFPTGSYKNLDKHDLKLDGTGSGSWKTTFTLSIAKLVLWNTLHPLNTRIAFGYQVATPVNVTNLNTYGGGSGTRGRVHPGNTFNVDLGLELSINQPWVIALDTVYTCTNRNKFHGIPGTTASGSPATVGKGFSDQLSFAPAIEYNFNAKMGIVCGAWFTVYGRNANNFVSGIFSWYWLFP